jgi:hypothetical protein
MIENIGTMHVEGTYVSTWIHTHTSVPFCRYHLVLNSHASCQSAADPRQHSRHGFRERWRNYRHWQPFVCSLPRGGERVYLPDYAPHLLHGNLPRIYPQLQDKDICTLWAPSTPCQFTISILGVCILWRVWDQVMGVFISVYATSLS